MSTVPWYEIENIVDLQYGMDATRFLFAKLFPGEERDNAERFVKVQALVDMIWPALEKEMKAKIFRLARPVTSKTMQHPTIRHFWHTGENGNPWRCESCLTPSLQKIDPPTLPESILIERNIQRPRICRKCRLEF